MEFRERLLATIAAARSVLEEPGVLVVGSEVYNLLAPDSATMAAFRRLRPELRHVVRSNLTLLSLLGPRPGMPDPRSRRAEVQALLRHLEAGDPP